MSFYVIPKSAEAFYDMPFEEYKNLDRKNQSYFKKLLEKSPKHAEFERDNPSEATTSMDIGTLWHSVLFGEIDPKEDLIACEYRRNTKAWKTAQESADNLGKKLVKPNDQLSVIQAYEAVSMVLRKEIADAKCEVTILFDLHVLDSEITIPCKARLDILDDLRIRDYKTTSKGVGRREFESTIGKFYYDMQAAFYQMAAIALDGVERPYQWITQENKAPYDVAGYEASDECLANGKSWLNDAVRKYANCIESGKFNGTWNGVFHSIDSPEWHTFQPEVDSTGITEVTTL